ncbi:protein root UVB sensitive 5-like isoform X2 [Papaver somniferum]|uniref:protein root UVB sensitive 5-like isoform X2 n=1 Tax=Papaver somniferum TaxID=3469 RepID=UPI000E6FBA34|nr:protein root UVB sensitive 5-like isoform X2 [Papaver somniferum]
MTYTLQQLSPIFALNPSRKRRSTISFQIHCSSEFSIEEKEGFEEQSNVVLVERYRNGTAKRYVIDGNSKVQTFLEEQKAVTNDSEFSSSFNTKVSWLPDGIKVFVLPSGFPGSVSDDYLEYMLLQLPTNITGWICSILVTSSLLKAVGVGSFSGTSAAATAAAIRWVSKDGLGTLGRFFIGGRFGDLFDNDPKQWRMYADFIGSAGSIFDLTTPLFPAYFLPLASLGNLTKAVARGLRDPSFRVVQNHFAVSGNLGEVAAKDSPGIQTSYTTLTLTWLSMRLLHLLLRYQSLSVLVFNTINLKCARMLVKSHVLHSVVPGYLECNKKENFLSWQKFLKPSIIFGVSLEEIIDGERSFSKVKALLQLYKREQYILVVNQQLQTEFQVFISFKVNATGLSVLRSIWQTYWLYEHWQGRDSKNVFDQLQESMSKLDARFDDFLKQLEEAGWDVKQIKLKVPTETLFEEMLTT